jgi:hypothetical protein
MQDFQTVDEIEEKFFPLGLSDVTADISVCVNEACVCLDVDFFSIVSSVDGLCSLSILFGY